MRSDHTKPILIRRREVAKLLGVHPNTLTAMVERGVLPAPISLANGRRGGSHYFDRAAVEAAISEMFVEAQAKAAA